MRSIRVCLVAAAAVILVTCASNRPTASGGVAVSGAAALVTAPSSSTTGASTGSPTSDQSAVTITPSTAEALSTAIDRTTAATKTATESTVATLDTGPATTTSTAANTGAATTFQSGDGSTETPVPTHVVSHSFPVAAGSKVSYAHLHHDYPATDIFTPCGSRAVAAVDGVITHVRYEDGYVYKIDDPALRGGRSVAILGDDGVRYYASHFASIDPSIHVGTRVRAGDSIAIVGNSGDAGVCHVHFGLSPNCDGPEWAVRRGVVYPWPYLDAWRSGKEFSPVAEIATWSAAHAGACATAMVMPHAAEAD